MEEKKKQEEKKEEIPVRLLERKLRYKGSVLEVYEDTVDVSGHVTHWDFIHHMEAGRLLMGRQYRHALSRFTLEIPAGKRDSEEEDFLLCAKRELEEETGYKCENLELLLWVNTTVAFLDEKIAIYLAKDLKKGQQCFDEDEEIFLEAWALEDLLKLISDWKMTDSKTVAAIQAYAIKNLRGEL